MVQHHQYVLVLVRIPGLLVFIYRHTTAGSVSRTELPPGEVGSGVFLWTRPKNVLYPRCTARRCFRLVLVRIFSTTVTATYYYCCTAAVYHGTYSKCPNLNLYISLPDYRNGRTRRTPRGVASQRIRTAPVSPIAELVDQLTGPSCRSVEHILACSTGTITY